MSATALRARCPICRRSIALWRDHTGRQVYVVHGKDVPNGDQCEASCWIAEDDELVLTLPPSKRPENAAPRDTASRARRMTKEHAR